MLVTITYICNVKHLHEYNKSIPLENFIHNNLHCLLLSFSKRGMIKFFFMYLHEFILYLFYSPYHSVKNFQVK